MTGAEIPAPPEIGVLRAHPAVNHREVLELAKLIQDAVLDAAENPMRDLTRSVLTRAYRCAQKFEDAEKRESWARLAAEEILGVRAPALLTRPMRGIADPAGYWVSPEPGEPSQEFRVLPLFTFRRRARVTPSGLPDLYSEAPAAKPDTTALRSMASLDLPYGTVVEPGDAVEVMPELDCFDVLAWEAGTPWRVYTRRGAAPSVLGQAVVDSIRFWPPCSGTIRLAATVDSWLAQGGAPCLDRAGDAICILDYGADAAADLLSAGALTLVCDDQDHADFVADVIKDLKRARGRVWPALRVAAPDAGAGGPPGPAPIGTGAAGANQKEAAA